MEERRRSIERRNDLLEEGKISEMQAEAKRKEEREEEELAQTAQSST